jgi:Zn-dependent protease with chaperone function
MSAIPAPRTGGRPLESSAARSPDSGAADLPKKILRGLSATIEPVRVSFLYRVGLLLAVVAMLVLPLIYIGLVALVGYAVYYHATENVTIFEGRGNAKGKFLVYVAPLVVGIVLLIFMLKPLFARRAKSSHPLSLRREDEPLLFTFVDRLCEIVGAPRPRRIDVDTEVNASASFMAGVWGVLTNRLVLTIGLPLVAGLNARQFTGVLAHEFGHFAQGSGMRLTFLVRTINMWFARVVYERDEWDAKMAEISGAADHWAISLILLITQGCVWVTRRVLWLLMWVAQFISSFLSRQMEFDADRYEARIAGSEAFAQTCERINMLGIASRAAFSDLGSAWRERRLCDNLPSLIRSRETQMPAEIHQAVMKMSSESKTGWLDTHPCDAARVASARAEKAPGIFTVDAPASALFADFAELSRRATVAFYFEAVGDDFQPQNLVPTEDLISANSKRREDVTAMRRYFCALVLPTRPVFPARFDMRSTRPINPDAAAERLLELRSDLCASTVHLKATAKQFEEADDRLVALERVRELMTAGIKLPKVDPKDLGISRLTADEIHAALKSAARERDLAREMLDRVLAGGMERLSLALSLEVSAGAAASAALSSPSDESQDAYDLADAAAAGSDDLLLDALRVLRESASDVESLRRHYILLGTVLSQVQPSENRQGVIDTVLWHSRKCSDLLRTIHTTLRGAAYPYSHANKQVSVAQYFTPALPPGDEPVAVHNAADSAIDAVYALYVRLLSDLASRAEKVEALLGLPPLPDPPEEEVEAQS